MGLDLGLGLGLLLRGRLGLLVGEGLRTGGDLLPGNLRLPGERLLRGLYGRLLSVRCGCLRSGRLLSLRCGRLREPVPTART
ncbi:hypothetical protein, partial [Streptomyces sp. SID337]|uniref:hypothetical protein n=1 Tax=Streptomyces sp. SID337 TaxID=2690262 RepID=UPI0023515AF7